MSIATASSVPGSTSYFRNHQQCIYNDHWKGLLTYTDTTARFSFIGENKAEIVGKVHLPSSIGSPVYLAQWVKNYKISPILVSPNTMSVIPISGINIVTGEVYLLNVIQYEQMFGGPLSNGYTAVEYNVFSNLLYLINIEYVPSNNFRVVTLFRLTNDERLIKVAMHKINNGFCGSSTSVNFISTDKLLITSKMNASSVRYKFTYLNIENGLADMYDMNRDYRVSTIPPSIVVKGNQIHLFERASKTINCLDQYGSMHIYLHGLKDHDIMSAHLEPLKGLHAVLKIKNETVKFDLKFNALLYESKPGIRKSTNLYKELQKSRGGVNALRTSRQYSVEVPPNKRNYLIDTFGLPDDWSEETLEINTTELSVGKGIAVSFKFNKDLIREFVVARNAWDQAFVKKDSKHRFVMSNLVLQALKENKLEKS